MDDSPSRRNMDAILRSNSVPSIASMANDSFTVLRRGNSFRTRRTVPDNLGELPRPNGFFARATRVMVVDSDSEGEELVSGRDDATEDGVILAPFEAEGIPALNFDRRRMRAPTVGRNTPTMLMISSGLLINAWLLWFCLVPFLREFDGVVMPALAHPASLWAVHVLVFVLFVGFQFTNPGLIQPGAIPSEQGGAVLVTVGDDYPKMRRDWCSECKIIRPLRASHCLCCNRCVRIHDHHCHMMANCVGKNNYHMYIGELVVLSLLCFYSLTLCICFATAHYKQWQIVIAVLSGIASICGLRFTIDLLHFHFGLMAEGMTTREHWKKKLPISNGRHPFDRGSVSGNIRAALCNSRRDT